jgi:hypothetical protein
MEAAASTDPKLKYMKIFEGFADIYDDTALQNALNLLDRLISKYPLNYPFFLTFLQHRNEPH